MSIENSPFVHVRLGMLYYTGKQLDKAIEQFEAVFSNETSASDMSAKDRSLARFFLAVCYWDTHEPRKALANVQTALQLDPHNNDAKRMLSIIKPY